ncbi:MAG: thioredoxin family protein [Candidatus Nephrothrix sp. EaCA]|nr:MAG: thioredoxin family protein [Candidatus Nephrothrix sp. EaCA]
MFFFQSSAYQIGDKVGDFKLKNVDGKEISLSQYANSKGVILIFDSNVCPYSRRYNERILALDKKYAPLGFPVVAVNANDANQEPGESYDEMAKYAKERHYTFPYLYDPTQDAVKRFGATNTPHVFILENKSSAWTLAYSGTIDNYARDAAGVTKRYVEEATDELLAGKRVTLTKTKAIGCSVKLKK